MFFSILEFQKFCERYSMYKKKSSNFNIIEKNNFNSDENNNCNTDEKKIFKSKEYTLTFPKKFNLNINNKLDKTLYTIYEEDEDED